MTNNTFYLDYNVTGAECKRLVKAISTFTGADSKYLGAPTFAYEVDYFTIDRNGVVSFDDRADSGEIEGLIETLVEQGFVAQVSNLGCEDDAEATSGEDADQPDEPEATSDEDATQQNEPEAISGEDAAQPEAAGDSSGEKAPAEDEATQPQGYGLTVTLPAASFTADGLNNLHSLIAAKGRLIRKALGIDRLPVQVESDTVSFPWFEGCNLDADEVKAYTHLISALCDMARNQKRIAAKDRDTENDKYAFRCFLLRMGFIGSEYKTERKILLRNLSGSSAFKSGNQRVSA